MYRAGSSLGVFFLFHGFSWVFFSILSIGGGVGDFGDLSALGRVFFGLSDDFLLFYRFLLAQFLLSSLSICLIFRLVCAGLCFRWDLRVVALLFPGLSLHFASLPFIC